MISRLKLFLHTNLRHIKSNTKTKKRHQTLTTIVMVINKNNLKRNTFHACKNVGYAFCSETSSLKTLSY